MRIRLLWLKVLATVLLLGRAVMAGAPLPRSTPEAQGMGAQDILALVQAADQTIHTMHSFMIVRHGQVVAEGWWKPEAADKPHVMWSVSKSFTSTAVGMAIAEGKLHLDDPVLKFFPDQAPAQPSENLKAMRVRDLLSMSCGHENEIKFGLTGPATPTVQAFLAHEVPHKPGTFFKYNTPGTYMLSAIVTKVTGQTVFDYLKTRLFEPLGIDDAQWDASTEGYSLGGYGLHICTEDLAKFGQLYLQKGNWQGKQLLPSDWIAQATSQQIDNTPKDHPENRPDWRQGYGYQFWVCQHHAFRADGKDCQFCVVVPEQDLVVAITAHTGQYQEILDLVWKHILPACHDGALPADAAADAQLKEAAGALEVRGEKR